MAAMGRELPIGARDGRRSLSHLRQTFRRTKLPPWFRQLTARSSHRLREILLAAISRELMSAVGRKATALLARDLEFSQPS